MTLAAGGPDAPARFRLKTCALDTSGVVGTRLSAISPIAPADPAVPTRLVLLNDATTGAFTGLVDERWSFAVRTGASAVLALKLLAPPESTTVGIVGAGQVGRGAAYVLPAALPVQRLVVFDRLPAASEQLARWVQDQGGPDVSVVESAEAVFAAADAVVLATTAREPFVRTAWLRAGCTVCSLGGELEVDLDAYTAVDKVVVDDWDAVRLKPDIRQLEAQGRFDRSRVYADYVELVAGRRPGRERSGERILVRSEGLATMDTALAHHLCQKAAARGLGLRLAEGG